MSFSLFLSTLIFKHIKYNSHLNKATRVIKTYVKFFRVQHESYTHRQSYKLECLILLSQTVIGVNRK